MKIGEVGDKLLLKDGLNFKKIGGWATVVSLVIITYYGLSTYKTYLEIKELKK